MIPDPDYVGNGGSAETNGVMNFDKDSCAAMTYYLHDFGTADPPNIPVVTDLNWMNTWDYCNKVARCADPEQTFNGTFWDVPAAEWFASAVQYVTANGMMAQILYNIEGGTGGAPAAFPDAASSDWFANAVGWAVGSGLLSGKSGAVSIPQDRRPAPKSLKF